MKRSRWILIGLPFLAIAVAGGLYAHASRHPAPVQPIAFSHAAHAGKRQISCIYCHQGVATTAHATIPAVETCYECHRVVMPTNPDVQKVMTAYARKEPIRWIRVTNLPEYVRFNHMRHIRKGVSCTSCHGDVARMDRVVKARALTMGECLQCHNQMKAPTDCFTCHY